MASEDFILVSVIEIPWCILPLSVIVTSPEWRWDGAPICEHVADQASI